MAFAGWIRNDWHLIAIGTVLSLIVATSKQAQVIAIATIAAMMQQTNSLLIALSVLMRFPQSDSRPFAVCIDEYYTRGL
jgi:hypothetical protein